LIGIGGQVAGGGVVADTCLALNRKCRSFDLDERPGTRPEIESHFWNVKDLEWPIKSKTRPDIIIFGPPAIAWRLPIPKSSLLAGQSVLHSEEGRGDVGSTLTTVMGVQ
jgi:hypothetical protein